MLFSISCRLTYDKLSQNVYLFVIRTTLVLPWARKDPTYYISLKLRLLMSCSQRRSKGAYNKQCTKGDGIIHS